MKAITIHQPWAALVAIGAKHYETRSWATKYRGPIAIHAGKSKVPDYGYFGGNFESEVCKYLRKIFYQFDASPYQEFRWIMDNLDYGAVIATAELIECYRMQEAPKTHRFLLYDSNGRFCGWDISLIRPSTELLFGDWRPGRYAWAMANVRLLDEPIPAKGRQGLWDW